MICAPSATCFYFSSFGHLSASVEPGQRDQEAVLRIVANPFDKQDSDHQLRLSSSVSCACLDLISGQLL